MRRSKRAIRKVCRFLYVKRRLLLCAVAAALACTAVAITAFADEDLNLHVVSASLKAGGNPVASGDKLSFTTSLELGYVLQDIHIKPNDPKAYFYDATTLAETEIKTTELYLLTLPRYLKCANVNLNIPIRQGTVTIGSVEYHNDNVLKMRFNQNLVDDIRNSGSAGISGINFFFASMLDVNEVGRRNSVEIELGPGQRVSVDVTENTPEDAMLKDKVCRNLAGEAKIEPTTGHFHWTVTIDPETPLCDASGTPDFTLAYAFKDALGSAQSYVPNSFKIAWARSTVVQKSPTPDVDPNTNTLSYTFSGADEILDAPVTITYETEPADGLFYSAQGMTAPANVTVRNTATLHEPAAAGGAAVNSKGGTATYEGKNWLEKTSGEIDLLNRTITWTLTVHTNGRGFNYIKIYDEFGGGSDPSGAGYLTYVSNSLTVNGTSASPAAGFNGHDEKLLYQLNDPTLDTYEIKYKTNFPNVSLDDNIGKNVSNSAWLDFEWKTGHGPGPGTEYGIPTIGKTTALGTSIVAKSGAYDPSNQRITWKVTINANRLDITSVQLMDTLTLTNQTGVLTNPAPAAVCTASSDATLPTYTLAMTPSGTGGAYDVVLDKGLGANNLGADTVQITYCTLATDPAFYANNATTTFHNTITATNVALSNAPSAIGPFSASADPTGTSRVLDKEAVSYQYNNNQITWKLTVNENRMHLSNTSVTDTLPPYCSFVSATQTVGAATSPITPNISGNALTFALGNIDQTTVITLHVSLDVNATNLPGGFLFGKSNTADGTTAPLAVANEAKLETDQYPNASVSEQSSIDVFNKLLEKQGVQDSTTGRVKYTIELNQNGADLTSAYPNGVLLIDDLPSNLFVDPADVHLYEASVNATTGAFTRGAEVTLDFQDKQLTPPNKLQLTLPSAMRNRPCILTYEAYILAQAGPVTLVNSAGLGVDGQGGGKTVSTNAIAGSGGSASLFATKSSLTITKTDANDPTLPLAGAVYGLYAPVPNRPGQTYLFQIVTTAIDANGDASATFVALTPNATYTLMELTAPPGYILAAPVTVIAGAAQTTVNLPVYGVRRATGGGTGGGTVAAGAHIPQTGDGSLPLLWAGLTLLSSIALYALRKWGGRALPAFNPSGIRACAARLFTRRFRFPDR